MRTKQYALPVIAAGLIYGGTDQILEQLQYPLSNCVLIPVNFVLRHSFPEQPPLAEFGAMPWTFRARLAAIGVIVTVVGTFVGLWAQARSQRHPSP